MTWGGLDAIFNPANRHLRDELERQANEVQVPGIEGQPNRVDLDKGVVRITRPRPRGAPRRPDETSPDAPPA